MQPDQVTAPQAATAADDAPASDDLFRREVRAFLSEALDDRLKGAARTISLLDVAEQQRWHVALARRGWAVPRWPAEHGGAGWSPERTAIFEDELASAAAPPLSPFMGLIGPVLCAFGTPEQQARHLPPLREGETVWCQGYSEPGSGSDLASLRTRAVRDGDVYVVDGQKIWTSYAHAADWMFCLVRTAADADRPQNGISFLLIDMKSPGVSVRPIRSIDGLHHLNEVFLTDVRVPVSNLVGEENGGWSIAKSLLEHERAHVANTGGLKARMERLRALAAAAPSDAGVGRVAEEPGFQDRFAALVVEAAALEQLALRARTQAHDRVVPSMLKLRGSELEQAVDELASECAGAACLPNQAAALERGEAADIGPVGAAQAMLGFLFGRASTIYGGSSEVQRGIIFNRLAATEGDAFREAQGAWNSAPDDDRRLLREAVTGWLADRYDFDARRRILASEAGWSPEAWRAFAEMGVLGVGLPEARGGVGGGAAEQAVVMEAFGGALVVEPFLETVVLGGALLAQAGGAAADRLVEGVVAGEVRLALADRDPDGAGPTSAARDHRGGWELSGAKTLVAAAPWATHLLVTARAPRGPGTSLFVVPLAAEGLTRRDYPTTDGRRASEVRLDAVRLPSDALLSAEGDAGAAVADALDRATAAVCAEAVGVMRRLLRDTLAYTQHRRQFGRTLSDFQVLQHRMADMSVLTEEAAAMAASAASALDRGGPGAGARVSAAKAFVSRAAVEVAKSAVQLHGAMGMTDELAIGHLFKRAVVIRAQFGSIAHHLARIARLGGVLPDGAG